MKAIMNILAAITCFTGVGMIVYYGSSCGLFATPFILVPILALIVSGACFLARAGYTETKVV